MKKESLNIQKYNYNVEDEKYIIYLIPEENNFTGFYIQKKDYGIMSSTIEIDTSKLECSIEEFIEDNITEWIEDCEDDIDKLENYYNPNMEI